MLVHTISQKLQKAKATNATDTSFPSKVPTTTIPNNDGVFTLGASVKDQDRGGVVENGVLIIPFAVASNDETFNIRVIGWRCVTGDSLLDLWVPVVLAELACTCSSVTGAAGSPVGTTSLFADTIVLTTGNDDVSIDIVSPTGNVIAHAMMDLKGFQKVEFTFDTGTGGGSGMNALVALL